MTAAVTALDWVRQTWTGPLAERVPESPVGPDLAVGLSQDFGHDAFCALPWETALEVDLLLTHGKRGPYYVPDPRGRLYGYERRWLPARAVVELEGENRARADIARLPNYTDTDYDR